MDTELELVSRESFVKQMDALLSDYDDAVMDHGPESYDAADVMDYMHDLCHSAIAKNYVPDKLPHPANITKRDGTVIMVGEKRSDYPEAAYWYVRKQLESEGIDWINWKGK